MDDSYKQFATDRQWEYVEAVREHGSQRKAAKAMGMSSNSLISHAINAIKAKAAKQGYSPEHDMTRTVPQGYDVKGVSTYYNNEGKPSGQWVKSVQNPAMQEEFLLERIAAVNETLEPVSARPFMGDCVDSLLNNFVFTDCHVGMMAWHKEGGDNWNLKIAESVLIGAMEHAIKSAPRAKKAVIMQLGDFMHFDGLSAVTVTSGHVLDADGRFGKVVDYAIRILRRLIDLALDTHEEVHVIMAEGNHDMASSVWLRKMFGALYENEPRVTVDDSELPYYCLQHGKVMLGCHHGHLKKFPTIDRLMAAEFPLIWGPTVYRYAHTGHLHHKVVKEDYGMTVEQHQTLSAKDAYSARGGYSAERKMQVITYHKDFGEVTRNSVSPEMFA